MDRTELTERCQNPFKKGGCDNQDIILSIMYKGEERPICSDCWKEIAEGRWKDKEWTWKE